MMKAKLIHLSYNLWLDQDWPDCSEYKQKEEAIARPYLRFDELLWREMVARMAEAGMNTIILDSEDGVEYSSHPEISVDKAWSREKLREELSRCRDHGIEVIPKLNFSACHDVWLGDYARMVSTPRYYEVCADLIAETAELFGGPRFIHIGMDEETAAHQEKQLHTVIRQHGLWWHDLNFYIEQVEKAGAAAMMWSDKIWHLEDPAEFERNVPKSVIQNNWFYLDPYSPDNVERAYRVECFRILDGQGYWQMPAASNYGSRESFPQLARWSREHIDGDSLMGMLQTTWLPMLEKFREDHFEAIDAVGEAFD